ncbi:MAG: DUF2220 family protein [Gordonia sp. (in: high G+C Gram-positive bacteria)]|uniref:Wadjet anti-phage system protein JetD domain-containing protein n=1 Tax=Gordonia sp. (in: high G+C Gram-positive bacteria) TaxID=84139 RepID=UPI0039E42898
MSGWSTPQDFRDRLAKRWSRGVYLQAMAAGEPFEPVDAKIAGPRTAELNSRRAEVADWICAWHAQAQRPETDVVYRIVGGRGLVGHNSVPDRLRISSLADLERFLGTAAQTRRYREILALTADRPSLREWAVKRPMRALEHHDRFEQLLAALDWIEANAGTGCQLREIDVPGIDTKFVEHHQRILLELGGIIVADDLVDPNEKSIAGRFGFATPDRRVRLRRLDPDLAWPMPGFDDVEVRAVDLARVPIVVDHVFIIENLATYLSFPQTPRSVAIFGGGYAATVAGGIDWLTGVDVAYWGDVDTHGFAILDRLRASLPSTRSILMDRRTLLAHRTQWGTEPEQVTRELPNLTPEESRLHRELVTGEHGDRVRLEQERIPMAAIDRGDLG